MPLEIRKLFTQKEHTFIEGGKKSEKGLVLIAAIAVIRNPWAGRGFVEDLRPEIMEQAPQLGKILVDEVLALAGSGDAVEGYGKAAVVGTNGEIEHGSALTHTLRFGNLYREAVGAKSYLSFTNVRGGPGCALMIPMMHKHDEGMRSHYLTIHTSIPDAPGPDEILIALGASIGGRPHHRIGDRYQDMREMAQ